MEQNPFQNNSESDDNQWEVSPEDLEVEDESEEEKPKRRSLFETSKEKAEREEEEATEKKKKSIFEKLLSGDDEKNVDTAEKEENDSEKSFLNPIVASEPLVEATPPTTEAVVEEFEQVVEDKIEQVDEELVHESEPTRVGELLADSSLLEDVVDKLEEGQDPVNAIENATEESLENPIPDATPEEIHTELEPRTEEVRIAQTDEAGEIPLPIVETEDDAVSTAPSRPTVQSPQIPLSTIPTAAELQNYAQQPEAAASSSSNDELEPMNDSYNRDPKTGRVLAAGLLGYALGRRGGRKRTEAKLQPIIDKQERNIDDLTGQLEESEEAVRRAALEQLEAEKRLREQQENAAHASRDEEYLQQEIDAAHAESVKQERAEFEEREKQLEQQLAQEEAMREEAERVASEAEIQQENISILQERQEKLVAQQELEDTVSLQNRAETEEEKRQEKAKAAAYSEQKAKEKARLHEAKREIDANKLPLAKVLEIAEFIPMKGDMNLRQLYETRRIDAVSLRRIVSEFNRGGNYEQAIHASLEAVELRSELKHEIKQDMSQYKQPEKAAHSVVDGIITATGGNPQLVGQSGQDTSHNVQGMSADESIIVTTEEPGLVISNGTAIVLGILAGIVIVLLVLLYSGIF